MKFTVKIDRNSVRVDEGSSAPLHVYTGSSCTEYRLTYLGLCNWRLSTYVIRGSKRKLHSRWFSVGTSDPDFRSGVFISREDVDQALANPGRSTLIRMTQENYYQPIHTMGGDWGPRKSYPHKHLKTMVKCHTCLAEFPHTSLKSETYDDWSTNNQCPKCDVDECCELEFEQLNDAMKALADQRHAYREKRLAECGGNKYLMKRRDHVKSRTTERN